MMRALIKWGQHAIDSGTPKNQLRVKVSLGHQALGFWVGFGPLVHLVRAQLGSQGVMISWARSCLDKDK